MKKRTMLATGLVALAAGATTTGAVAASRGAAEPVPVAAEAPATTPAPAEERKAAQERKARAERRARAERKARQERKRRAKPEPAPRRAKPEPAPRRSRPEPAPVPRSSRPQEARRAAASDSGFPASMDPDRNPNYERDLNSWVDCMNARGLRTIATMTGITAGGWTYGEPRTAREKHLQSEAGWDEARAIELACQEQAFGAS